MGDLMLRVAYSVLIGFAVIASAPALAQDQAQGATAPVVAAADPAAPAPATDSAASTAKPAPTPKVISIEPDPILPAAANETPVEPSGSPPTTLTASVDLAEQRMIVMENGEFRFSWPISSGARGYATPTGVFRPKWAARMWRSRQYGLAPMPHAVFINGGIAVHATYATGALGRPASHGCIRLSPSNAKTFYNLVHRHGMQQTEVSVHGSPKWRGPAIASQKKKRPAQEVAQTGFWFFGASPSNYASEASYNPASAPNNIRAPKQRLNAYRKKGSNKVVYFRQPVSSF
jgi:lipoprotein-anchoring transpeptidase ErfK/SrfK